MSERISCVVPFCRRTCRGDGTFSEWICARHWPLVPRQVKVRRRQALRRIARLKRMWDGNRRGQVRITATGRYAKYGATLHRAYEQNWAAWDLCKARAIEAAGGIA